MVQIWGPVLLKLRVAEGRLVDLSSNGIRTHDSAQVAADALCVAPGQVAGFERQNIDHLYGLARFRLVVRLRSAGSARRGGGVATAWRVWTLDITGQLAVHADGCPPVRVKTEGSAAWPRHHVLRLGDPCPRGFAGEIVAVDIGTDS